MTETPKTIMQIVDRVCEKFELAPTPQQIRDAEENMLSASMIVEILEDNLEEARKYKIEARDRYIALCGKVVKQ